MPLDLICRNLMLSDFVINYFIVTISALYVSKTAKKLTKNSLKTNTVSKTEFQRLNCPKKNRER